MWNFGTNLDPRAPLSNAIEPFVPPLLGEGKVGQFKTIASWEIGLWVVFPNRPRPVWLNCSR